MVCGGDLSEDGRWKFCGKSIGNELASAMASVSYDPATFFEL